MLHKKITCQSQHPVHGHSCPQPSTHNPKEGRTNIKRLEQRGEKENHNKNGMNEKIYYKRSWGNHHAPVLNRMKDEPICKTVR